MWVAIPKKNTKVCFQTIGMTNRCTVPYGGYPYLVFWVVYHRWFPLSIHVIVPIFWFLGIGVGNELWFVPVLGE